MILPASRPAWLVSGLLALAACAPPPASQLPRPEVLLTDQPPPVGRSCLVSGIPEALPPVDLVVDSAALHRDIAELWRERRLGTGYAVLTLAFDRNGWNARREVIEHDLPAEVADSLQELVFARRRSVEPGAPWGVRLRIDVENGPRFRLGRQEVCAPRLLEVPLPGSVAGGWGPHERFVYRTTGTRMVWVRVLVDEHGGIAEAEMEHGAATPGLETALLNLVRLLGFEPATVDGVPVAGWARIRLPVQ